MLPESLKKAIETEAGRYSPDQLIAASEELSKRYRERTNGSQNFMQNEMHRIAYASVRMPATYAALVRILSEVKNSMAEPSFQTLLDLGSGPGTAFWAAKSIFSELQNTLLLEQDQALIALGKRMMQDAYKDMWNGIQWQQCQLQSFIPKDAFDLVISSYALGELTPEVQYELLKKAWNCVGQVLILVEPGTMAGFARIRQAREELIALGGYVMAPCPHQNRCPMPANDWCHFSERVDRTSLHRKMKEGTLSYEDEKYSYVVVTKQPFTPCPARILRHPQKHSGHIDLTLCTSDGLKKTIISKKEGPLYKQARKASWGDSLSSKE